MPTRKNRHLKRNIAIAVAAISIMIVAVLAGLSSGLFTGSSNPAPEPTSTTTNGTGLVGVKVGDIFTYKLTGSSVLGSPDVVTPEEFSQYNDTDYYQVTVTGVGSSTVMLETTVAIHQWHSSKRLSNNRFIKWQRNRPEWI